jgi:hypothetical protein
MKLFGIDVEYLSEKHKLFKPNHMFSNTGVLPEMLRHLQSEVNYTDILKDHVENLAIRKSLQKHFPNKYSKVIFLICDGIGVHHLQQMKGIIWDNIDPDKDNPGLVACASFPTITTTNMTSLSTGKFPKDHGFVGYNIYNEKLGTVFNGLNGLYLKNGEVMLIHDDHDNSTFVDGTTIPEMIVNNGTKLTFLVPKQQKRDGLLKLIAGKAPLVDYETSEELVQKLLENLNDDSNGVIGAYIGTADYMGHIHGPSSQEYVSAISGIEQLIQLLLSQPIVISGDTLIILTSDHGQVDIDHEISKYFSYDDVKQLQKQGITLSTTGRVIHVYAKDPQINIEEKLKEIVDDKALVISSHEALELFGGPETKFKERIGDYLIICQDKYIFDVPEVIKYDLLDIKLKGQHGSLTKEELFVPVGIWPNRNES